MLFSCKNDPRYGPSPRQVLPGDCAKERAQLGAGTGARPGAGGTEQPALPHAGGRRPPRPAAAGTQEALPGRQHLPCLHGGGSCGRVPGAQPGHPDGRSPPPDGFCQHHDQPLCALGVLTSPHQNHELRLAPGRDSGGPAVRALHLGGDGRPGLPGCPAPDLGRLRHRGQRHAHHLRLRRGRQHRVRTAGSPHPSTPPSVPHPVPAGPRDVTAALLCRMGVALHQTGHGHSHGAGGEQPNASVRAAFVHVVGDLLQSVGVLVASYIIFFKPEYKYVDPICTFLFSALVLGTTLTILRDVLLVLMEGTPKGMDFNAVRETLLAVQGVEAVHSLHIWALTAAQPLLSVHIAINAGASAQEVLEEASSRLQGTFRFHTTTIQVESYSEEMRDCRECQPPRD
ncbi:proton-coupled zinc antiporter SLC30A2 isoform X1 [Chroicocephalus ridibundus]|uniref:proton-coupled zinc antiporter SLC30A2 isoform X1 n=1 Tax=Chroicocephalus ridibundus TaxID=1192867 RepID=UPI002FDE0AC1